uniref:Uncharacterized protein n=1 Tax=Arundo donax TaxID=35708 RepID=A0A0A9C788_ARUDO
MEYSRFEFDLHFTKLLVNLNMAYMAVYVRHKNNHFNSLVNIYNPCTFEL